MVTSYLNSVVGTVKVVSDGEAITQISICKDMPKSFKFDRLTSTCIEELKQYFRGERKVFTFPIKYSTTKYGEKVFVEMSKIEYGDTISYSKLAEKIYGKNHARSVAQTVGRNSHIIVIPCHRVVGENGIGGFHYDIEVKKILLDIEKK